MSLTDVTLVGDTFHWPCKGCFFQPLTEVSVNNLLAEMLVLRTTNMTYVKSQI
jgi:hypothetical protein